jgi:ABC-2 type transport system permease protein
VLGLGLGTVQLDDEMTAMAPRDLSLLLATLSVVASMLSMLLVLGVTSLFIALGSPRRDQADRSHEFWLSLPSGHAESLLAPVLVHLLLVPAAALLIGYAVALPISMVTVGRVVGLGEWFSLPWGQILGSLGALLLRVLAGLPLALLWLLPLLLAAMLANALFRRWGLPLLVVLLVLLSVALERVFGQPLLTDTLAALFMYAGTSLAGAGGAELMQGKSNMPLESLSALPGWALRDFGAALGNLATPLLVGVLLVSGALFMALLAWRRRGASMG